MAYDPNIYNPYGNAMNIGMRIGTPVHGINYIDSIDEVKNYVMPPNSVSPPFMLKSDDVFIIKMVDGSGGATLHAYRFEEIDLPSDGALSNDYVTKADLDAFAARIMEAIDGKLTVPEAEQPARQSE